MFDSTSIFGKGFMMLHRLRVFLVATVVLAVMAAIVITPAFAAKGGGNHTGSGGGKHGGTTSSTGSCTVTPNPVNVGAQYTVNGTGFTAGELLDVYVQDSHGTQALMTSADTSGNFSVSSYASWSGTDTVSVYDNGGRKMVYLTGCTVQVN